MYDIDAMSDDSSIRLENLKKLKLGASELRGRLGSTYSLWSDLIKGRKSFGEKLARRIEEGLQLPRGWLDQADGEVPVLPPLDRKMTGGHSVQGLAVEPDKEALMQEKEMVWALFSRLDPAQRARLVAEMYTLGQAGSQTEGGPLKNAAAG